MKKRPGTVRRKTKFRGVYERASEERTHKGELDICFDIAYKLNGKLTWEKVGWLSEGYSALLADQVRSERIRSMRHGLELPRQKKKAPYLKEAAEKYLKWVEGNRARKGKVEKSRYENHIKQRFGDKRISDITSFDLERMKAELGKEGLAPSTVKHCLITVREIFNKARAWKIYQGENPIKGVKMPKIQNQRERFLSYEEADLILKKLKAKSEVWHDMAVVSLHTGMRAGEVFNIRGYDLDFDNLLLTVSDPKNKTARKAYMTAAVKEILWKRNPDKPEDYVFPSRDGKRWGGVSHSFSRVIDDLKLNVGITDRRQRVTYHTLRHSFASWLALRGETIQTIGELLGHKSLAMTMRYSHLTADHKRQAVRGLEADLNGKTKKVVEVQGV